MSREYQPLIHKSEDIAKSQIVKLINERKDLDNMKLMSKTNKKRVLSLIMSISLLIGLLVTVATALEQEYSEVGNFDEVYVVNVNDSDESGSEGTHEGESEYNESFVEDTEQDDTACDESFVEDTEQDDIAYNQEYLYTYYMNDEEYSNIESFYYTIAEASATDVRLRAGTARGEPGATVFVPIEMEQNLRGLGAIVYYIEFDATYLELVRVTEGNVLPIPMAPPLGNNPLRVLSVDLSGAGAAAGVTGTLATAEFRIRDNAPLGETAVGLRTHDASGPVGDLGERTHSATGSTVTITTNNLTTDIRLQAGTVTGAPGATVFVPIEMEENLRGLGAIVYYIEFDATRLELVRVIEGDVLPIPMEPPLNNNPLRVLSVDLSGAGAAAGVTGRLATVEFRIRDNAPLGETTVGLRTHDASGPVGNLGDRTHIGLDGSVIIEGIVEREVTFLLNDGTTTVHAAVTVSDGSIVTPPIVPTRVGYTFRNWYTTAAATTAFNFGTPITSNVTLHAGWTTVDPDPGTGARNRTISFRYYVLDDNDNLVNVGARQYLRPEGYVFNLQNVQDRNALPGNNVYVFEGWRVFLGGTYNPNYLTNLNVDSLRGTFTIPHVNVALWESLTLSETVGEAISLHAVWSLYEAGDDTQGGQDGAGGADDTGTLPKTGVESGNTLLFAGLLLLVVLVATSIIVAMKERHNKANSQRGSNNELN